ncbi:MAG: c-type cytochrome, methanol metabolism-related [Dongiaceae bacterium]
MTRKQLHGTLFCVGLTAAAALAVVAGAAAGGEEKPYSVGADGKVDWYTFSGFRRYHAECHVCHGPDGLGSSFGPALAESLKTMGYDEFLDIVVNGKEEVSSSTFRKMPAFGENRNVMCFVDDIYAYLKARSDGAIGRGRPQNEPRPAESAARDNACMG